ncbi:MAG: DNA translocase FtsK 4TM domain-containing protein, partial [Syntrophomonas sp.]|nr:DNA translocase FtsK 4TM domain-containing protein [Syntrophomonas sp.]
MVKKKETRLKVKPAASAGSGSEITTGNIIKTEIISVIVFMVAVFLLVSIKNFKGIPDDARFIGIIGTYLSRGLQSLFGTAAMIAPFYLLFWSIHIGVYRKWWSARMWGLTLLVLTVLAYVSVYHIPLGLNAWDAALKGLGGGYVGGGLAYLLIRLLGKVGTSIFLILCILLSLIMILEKSLSEMAAVLWNNATKIGTKLNNIMYYDEEPAVPSTVKAEAVIIHPLTDLSPENDELITARRPANEPLIKELKPEKTKTNSQLELVYRAREEMNHYVKPSFEMLSIVESDRTIDKKNIKDSIAVLEDTFA